MPSLQIALDRIAAKATPLHERWQLNRTSLHANVSVDDADYLQAVLGKWAKALSANQDTTCIARRLAHDGIDEAFLGQLVGDTGWSVNCPLPKWTAIFSRVIDYCLVNADGFSKRSLKVLGEVSPQPFEEFWSPFVAFAHNEFMAIVGKSATVLSDVAQAQFQRALLTDLSKIGEFALGLEFSVFQAKQSPLSAFLLPESVSSSSATYAPFIQHILQDGLIGFFEEYAVLARLISLTIENWISTTAEFCSRVVADRTALANLLNEGRAIGLVESIKTGVSDHHNFGRSVVIVKFDSGLQSVYKPKSLAMDQAIFTFIEWLNKKKSGKGSEHGSCRESSAPVFSEDASEAFLQLPTLRILDRTTHGWMEFVEHASCSDEAAVDRYFQRVGMTLCLAHIMNGTDLHMENIVACGEYPLLIDMETFLQVPVRTKSSLLDEKRSADALVYELMHRSVIHTGLLPMWRSANGKSYDLSGIGAELKPETMVIEGWEAMNSDRMAFGLQHLTTEEEFNQPKLGDIPISSENYQIAIEKGFAVMYRGLIELRDELLADHALMNRFKNLPLRFIMRATRNYDMIARRLLHPEFLRDAMDRCIEMDRLAVDFVQDFESPDEVPNWKIYEAERSAMERLDIPFFTTNSQSDDLLADGQIIEERFFEQCGLSKFVETIEELSEDDLARQMGIFRASMYARFNDSQFSDTRTSDRPSVLTSSDIVPFESQGVLERSEILQIACDLATQIRDAAIEGEDKSLTWFMLQIDPKSERLRLSPMGFSLYEGRLGVALFFAALYRVTGNASFKETAQSILLPSRSMSKHPLKLGNKFCLPLGGASGFGGSVYAYKRIAEMLDDPELHDLAMRNIEYFVPEVIVRDEELDVIAGAAGGILGLLAHSQVGDRGLAIEAAERCGDHLLRKRVMHKSGFRTWHVPGVPQPLTGFSHGAAGFALSLLRLFQVTGKERFREAAEEAIAYENGTYSDEQANWPDLRTFTNDEEPKFSNTWCHGATGIGFARLGGLEVLDNPIVRTNMDQAAAAALAAPLTDYDHLCCGNFGRIDFLFEAGRRLDRPFLVEQANLRTSQIVRRAESEGRFRLHASVPKAMENVSFFQGLSGIGYQLLRMIEPQQLPCVLLWD